MFETGALNLTEDISVTLMDKENNVNFVVVQSQNTVPQLRYRQKLPINETYKDMEKVVDFKEKIKPSMYHQVEQSLQLSE